MSKLRKNLSIKMLSLIKKNPGLRPRELNNLLGLEHSASLRNYLIKQGQIRKKKKGSAVHYYIV